MATNHSNNDDLNYNAEGTTPLQEKDDPTNAGYDEAAHTGPGRYGVQEGEGGVFGTTGGGSYGLGMHVEEVPGSDSGKGQGKDR